MSPKKEVHREYQELVTSLPALFHLQRKTKETNNARARKWLQWISTKHARQELREPQGLAIAIDSTYFHQRLLALTNKIC